MASSGTSACASILNLVFSMCRTAYSIVFSIWVLTILHEFQAKNQEVDKNYAIAMAVFLIWSAVGHGYYLMTSCCRLLCRSPAPEGRKSASYIWFYILSTLIAAAVDLVFVVRTCIWSTMFQAAGEHTNAAYSIAFSVLGSLGALNYLVGACLLFAGWVLSKQEYSL